MPINTIGDLTAKIRRWYARDHQGFQTLFDKAIENVQTSNTAAP